MSTIYVTDKDRSKHGNMNDEPSVSGKFDWIKIGSHCVPCILKSDGTQYICVRIAEHTVLSTFLQSLHVRAISCSARIKSLPITQAEANLLDEINANHCLLTFGRKFFSPNSDFIVKVNDLQEFINFLSTSYHMVLGIPSPEHHSKCGFFRIENSVVPYVVAKDGRKYFPKFYFTGDMDLRSVTVTLESWDVAYLKLCFKIQGIEDEGINDAETLFAIAEDDLRLYFPANAHFEEYWPKKREIMAINVSNIFNACDAITN